MAPPSQRYRNVGFYLETGFGPPVLLDLYIRPEELTRQEPSRLTVQQTLGGAWADSWDRGVSTISLSGHCGWRGAPNGLSGEDGFAALRDVSFAGWHASRALAVASGQDPSAVTLTFIDSLDGIVALVAPKQFQLRRSKTSPLLMRYNIQLVVLDDTNAPVDPVDAITLAMTNPLRWLAGITGLGNVIATIQSCVAAVQQAEITISSAIGVFTGTAVAVLGLFTSLASAAQGILDAPAQLVLGVATSIATAARTAFAVVAAAESLPDILRLSAMEMAAAWNEALCLLNNCFTTTNTYPDYSALYGASGCSSTGGGLPASVFTVAGVNPFYSVLPAAPAPVTVSAAAGAAMAQLSGDPIPLVGNTAGVGQSLQAIGQGVQVAG